MCVSFDKFEWVSYHVNNDKIFAWYVKMCVFRSFKKDREIEFYAIFHEKYEKLHFYSVLLRVIWKWKKSWKCNFRIICRDIAEKVKFLHILEKSRFSTSFSEKHGKCAKKEYFKFSRRKCHFLFFFS